MDAKKTQTLLIVDDEPANISLLNEVLKTDYNVMAAKDGAKALAVARSSPQPDLILLDIVMPEMDGYEVFRSLKDFEETRRIPVIFVTSRGEDADQTKGLEMGAVDYISKPFNPAVVRARVRTQLELKQSRDFLEWMLNEKTKELEQMEKEYSYLFLRKQTVS